MLAARSPRSLLTILVFTRNAFSLLLRITKVVSFKVNLPTLFRDSLTSIGLRQDFTQFMLPLLPFLSYLRCYFRPVVRSRSSRYFFRFIPFFFKHHPSSQIYTRTRWCCRLFNVPSLAKSVAARVPRSFARWTKGMVRRCVYASWIPRTLRLLSSLLPCLFFAPRASLSSSIPRTIFLRRFLFLAFKCSPSTFFRRHRATSLSANSPKVRTWEFVCRRSVLLFHYAFFFFFFSFSFYFILYDKPVLC